MKIELKKYKLGDIADIIGGVAYSPEDVCSSGIRILRGGNIQSKTIELKILMSYYQHNIESH